jgi:hypothetical protein
MSYTIETASVELQIEDAELDQTIQDFVLDGYQILDDDTKNIINSEKHAPLMVYRRTAA